MHLSLKEEVTLFWRCGRKQSIISNFLFNSKSQYYPVQYCSIKSFYAEILLQIYNHFDTEIHSIYTLYSEVYNSWTEIFDFEYPDTI